MAPNRAIKPPAAYVAQIERMARDLRKAHAEGQELLFVMPPEEFMVIGELAQLGERFVRSEDARRLVQKFIKDAPKDSQGPTVFMLRCALDHAGIPCEIVGLGQLGLSHARAS